MSNLSQIQAANNITAGAEVITFNVIQQGLATAP